jgi:hypothetical protein
MQGAAGGGDAVEEERCGYAFAVSAEGMTSKALSAVAVAAGFALFWFVSRFD